MGSLQIGVGEGGRIFSGAVAVALFFEEQAARLVDTTANPVNSKRERREMVLRGLTKNTL